MYISQKELRPGNLITDKYWDSFHTIITVESIDHQGINLEILDDGRYPEFQQHWIEPYYHFDQLHPIPITEDLLIKLNAVKIKYRDFPSFNLNGLQINFIDGQWQEYVSQIKLKGLHHLQNIFYFRFDEELVISENLFTT